MRQRQQAEGNIGIDEFFQVIKQCWDTIQEPKMKAYEEAVKNKSDSQVTVDMPVQIYEAFPVNSEINEELPIITYMELTKVSSATMKELKARIRHIFDDESDPHRKVAVLGKRYDYQVAFTVWADTNKQAKEIAREFQSFIEAPPYIGLLKRLGIVDYNFLRGYVNYPSVQIPSYLENRRNYTLEYIVTAEELTVIELGVIEQITFSINTITASDTDQ